MAELSAHRWSGSQLVLLMLLSISSYLLSSEQIFLILGHSVNFSPLLYFFAGQTLGFLPGLLVSAAAALGLAEQGQWAQTAVPIALYLATYLLQRRGLMLAEAALGFHLAWSLLAVALHAMSATGQTPALEFYRYLQMAAFDLVLAAVADIILKNFQVTGSVPWLSRTENWSLDDLIRTTFNINVALIFAAGMTWEGSRIRSAQLLHGAGLLSTFPDSAELLQRNEAGTPVHRSLNGNDVVFVAVPSHMNPASFAREAFPGACKDFEVSAASEISNVKNSDFLNVGCKIYMLPKRGADSWIIVNTAAIRKAEEKQIFIDVIALASLLIFSGLYFVLLRRTIRENFLKASGVLEQFGTANLSVPQLSISDLQNVVNVFAIRNNSYINAVENQITLASAVQKLQKSIKLSIISDITFDEVNCNLHFTTFNLDGHQALSTIHVHPTDLVLFRQVDGHEDAMVEFRTEDGDAASHMITLQGAAGKLAWSTGVMIAVRQPKRMREFLHHHARLIDLGGMASAICHELKQPLFTIALAAQSIGMLLDGSGEEADDRIKQRSSRIREQVARAQEIIDRIANYGRISFGQAGISNFTDAFEGACLMLEATLQERGIQTRVSSSADHPVPISRIALEQVMVNVVQNSIDAIMEARSRGARPEAGLIEFVSFVEHDRLICRIMDDGMGLGVPRASTLFEPFFTTKLDKGGSGLGLFVAKQIIIEAKGQIDLRKREPHGTILEIMVPFVRPEDLPSASG